MREFAIKIERDKRVAPLPRRTGRLAALAAAVMLVLSGGAASAAESLSVRLDWSTHAMHTPFFLALEKGWFAKAGLEPKIEDGNGSTTTVQLVSSKNFDVGHASLAPMALAKAKGLPVTSIAGFIRKGDMGILVPADSGIKTPADLVGKKVAYTTGSLEGPFVEPFFKKNGVDPSKVGLLNVEAATKVSTYVSATSDAVISTVPYFLPITDAKRKSNGILFADFGMNLPGFGLIANTETLKQKPEAIKKFASIVAGAWAYIYDGHEDEAVAAVLKHRPNSPMSAPIMRAQLDQYRDYFYTDNTRNTPIGVQSAADWEGTIKDMVEAKAVKGGMKPEDVFTNDYLDHAWFKKLTGM